MATDDLQGFGDSAFGLDPFGYGTVMALRWQLLLALRDSLRQISPANGYATQPRLVEIGLRNAMQLTQHPALFLEEESGSLHPQDTHTSRGHDVRVAVYCFVAGNSGIPREQALYELEADVYQRCVEDNPRLGGLAIHTDEATPDETDEGVLALLGTSVASEGVTTKHFRIIASEEITL